MIYQRSRSDEISINLLDVQVNGSTDHVALKRVMSEYYSIIEKTWKFEEKEINKM